MGGDRQKRKIQQENVACLGNSVFKPAHRYHEKVQPIMKRLFTALLLASSSTLLSAQADIASQATDPAALTVAKGFKVELLYSVPKAEQGSWVTMTIDDKGRILASDQYGAFYRVTVPAPGAKGKVKVEKIDLDIGHAQGSLYAFDSLYVVVNGKSNKGRGLYRVMDTDNDDKFDTVKLLKKFAESGGEHGPHAVILGPKKKSLYVVVGNQTPLVDYNRTRVPPFWGEDQLLPRVYGRGFMRGVDAPRGWIAKTDKEGKNWEIMATGFRNQYDAAFNHHGELFTFDADMEWDVNTPWYRPTRVNHVVSGAEFGWRNGSGKFPHYYEDSLPATIDIGPGSPTGVCFGYGAAFPEKYQKAFFINDWSYGKMYAVHFEPEGSTYKATFEEFVAGQPLPLTDLEIHQQHKCMYFMIGGRRTQGGLYRVTYAGKESTSPAKLDKDGVAARTIRRSLEKYHGKKDPRAVKAAWDQLGSSDRYIRNAARTAIEHQPANQWREKALVEKDTQTALSALLALVRVGNTNDQVPVLKALGNIKWEKLSTNQKLQLVRIYSLCFIRLGEPNKETKVGLGKALAANLPDKNTFVNEELVQLLVYLQSEDVAKKAIALLEAAPTQEEQIHYVKSLRLLREGWDEDSRNALYEGFGKAKGYRGGASFRNFIADIQKDMEMGLMGDEKKTFHEILAAAPAPKSPLDALSTALAGRGFVENWQVSHFEKELSKKLTGRDFKTGKTLFGATACYACHRFQGDGGSMGPDLTGAGGRFSAKDLLESIIEPSKEVSDQYAPIVIKMKDGTTITGRIGNMSGDRLMVAQDMFDPQNFTRVDRREVESIEYSKISPMPPMLIGRLEKGEVLDLLAYILSGGNEDHAMFK